MVPKAVKFLKYLSSLISKLARNFVRVWRFFFLLFFYFLNQFLIFVSQRKILPAFLKSFISNLAKITQGITNTLDAGEKGSIPQQSIIRLSIRNMLAKKSRSMITIGGMSIGVAAIVFLVSIGYGLQELVVSRVAELKEMKQADAMPAQASNLHLTDETLAKFKQINGIKAAHPLISLVGRVSFKNSITDVVVHGATTDYLEESAINPVKGNFYDSRILARKIPREIDSRLADADFSQGRQGEVAGETVQAAEYGKEIRSVNFKINPNEWIRVRESPDTDSKVLGYTKRMVGTREGLEVWGSSYYDQEGNGKAGTDGSGQNLGKWIGGEFPLWEQTKCDVENLNCEDGSFLKVVDEEANQVWKTGFFAEINIAVENGITSGMVLGDNDSNVSSTPLDRIQVLASTDSTDSAELEIFEFLKDATQAAEVEKEIIQLGDKAEMQALINRSMLQILSLDPDEAIGSKFKLKFVVVGNLVPEKAGKKLETEFKEYTIAGIISGQQNPVVWVPFIDLRGLGVERYSQAKLVVNNERDLPDARKQVEAMGYKTSSVADTVAKINSLFSTVRVLLLSLGMIALVVAALGMFNTLTVSLLERTREVGVMKAMGVKSNEVKDLFLTESMIMGVLGGVLGIIFGWVAGKGLSFLLTVFAVFKGAGAMDISFIPMFFIFIIIFLSLLVGFITGFYPARRATSISALNALRYE